MYTYHIGDNLYLNITNDCPNNCRFCIRKTARTSKLWLAREPRPEEVLADVDDQNYPEIVFCGFGEPLSRPDVVLAVAQGLRDRGSIIRIDTNGLGELVTGQPIVDRLAGWIDAISISLVAQDSTTYQLLTASKFGAQAYPAMLDFTRRCVDVIPEVEMSVVELPEVDVEHCRNIARSLGTRFRVRQYRRGFTVND